MRSLLDQSASDSIAERLSNLTPTTIAQWGKMDVAQMLKHCQGPLNVALEHVTLQTKLGFFQKLMMKLYKPLLYNDKAWKHGLPTVKEFVINTPADFNPEKEKLTALINEFTTKKDTTNWPEHPLFGYFTPQQWGQMQYKHLDHHLTQFGV